MVKQLGVSTLFIMLSCADLRWDELIEFLQQLNKTYKTDFAMSDLSCHERCSILDNNPVIVTRHFQYSVDVFFNLIVIDGHFGKSKYCDIKVEFQVSGSPHINSFIWIMGAPILSMENIYEYIEWVDTIVSTDFPDPLSDAALYELVKTYQVHHHSKSSKKYKNYKCRFHFGRFFTDRAIIVCPLSTDLTSSRGKDILNKTNETLKNVSEYINEKLNPGQRNIYVQPGKTILNTSPSRKYRVCLIFQKIDTMSLLKYQKIIIFKFSFDDHQSLASLMIILRQV